MNLLKKKVTKENLFSEYIKIINGVLQLSNRECEVLSSLFNNITRKDIINNLHISAANLSRYLGVLKNKGLLVKNTNGKWVVNDIILPNVINNTIELKFILEISDSNVIR